MIRLVLMLACGQFDGGSADAGASDAGVADAPIVVMDVVRGSLLVRPEDGGVWEQMKVEEGCYLPTESCIRVGKQKARKEGELEEANRQQMKWIGVAFGAGAATGAVLTIIGLVVSGHVK